MYWFTADEHFGHARIIEHTNRPEKDVDKMDELIINNFNSVVDVNDITVHAGDFCWVKRKDIVITQYIKRLKGNHIFLKGNHDYWMPCSAKYLWSKYIKPNFIVVCHYAMRVWDRSHYNSWQLYGHSHGMLKSEGKQMDVGVDTHNYYPYSLDEIKEIMKTKPDNFNYIRR